MYEGRAGGESDASRSPEQQLQASVAELRYVVTPNREPNCV